MSYALAPNANGSATVTVRLKDSGGTASGGSDTSAPQTFTITATPVNDAPTFSKGVDQLVNAADGAVSVPGWATAISAGPSNEAGQSVSFLVQAVDPSLFSVQPAVAPDGTLTFTPAAGGGTTTVSVKLMDSGGTANGGQNLSAVSQFVITISPAVAGPIIDAALLNDTAPGGQTNSDGITSDPTVSGTLFDTLDVVSLTASIDRGAAAAVSINSDGSFVYNPPLARDGSADGNHIAHLVAQNSAGGLSKYDLSFTLDTTAPLAPSLILSAASGVVSSQTSNASRVTLIGTTDPGDTVLLNPTAGNALANNVGNFEFSSIPLNLGDNVFTTQISDAAGNVGQATTTIRRVSTTAGMDPVLLWNQTVLQAVRVDASNPTFASRDIAMVQAAVYDVVNAIEGRTGYYVTLAAPSGASLEASISGAAHEVLSYLFPAQHALFDSVLATSLSHVTDGTAKTNSVSFGRQIGDAIIALRANDGSQDFVDPVQGTQPGQWQPTAPLYAVALDPQWANVQPWVMTSPDQFLPPGPPDLTSQAWANAYNDVMTLGAANSTVRTADQTQIARFWADGAGTSTPVGHWNLVAEQIASATGNSIAENARLFAMLDFSLADAGIVAFNAKYTDNFWRPITAIQNGDSDGNGLTTADPTWQPLLVTPAFPEYVSGHSTFSGAAAAVLTAEFGDNYAFTTTSEGLAGVTRSFTSFDAAAAEAGRSRVYGGIHYEFSNEDGLAAGKSLASYVLTTFDTSSDTIAPRVLIDTNTNLAVAANASITGHVLDNLSGVASLTASVDGGPAIPVTYDALGHFVFTTSLPVDGSGDGSHTVLFTATDASGNVSAPAPFTFTLDTTAPTFAIQSPTTGGSVDNSTLLTGSVSTSGAAIVSLSYRFSGQTAMPLTFDAQTGNFSTPLDVSKLSPGATTLTITARDAAGNTSASVLNLNLATRAPFTISSFTPLNGAVDVGTTYHPQVFFSRPVNPASLTSANFYATDPSGAKLAANIVPSGDGTFAWLFFTSPMPSSSEITVHLDGSTIAAAADGAMLDADNNGTAGGQFTFQFSTVSLTPLLGTSLSGKVLDVGPDLKPMTFDDVRVGPDGIMHTADDVFLLPIAGVKVHIVGLDSQFVLTDANGNFHFDSVPAGDVKLSIDGRTATNAPTGVFFPEMVMDLTIEAGRANTVMGTMGSAEEEAANRNRQEVYLPRLQMSILQPVSNTTATTITVNADAAANLTPEQRSMLTLTVPAGSLRDQNGNPVASGQVGISTVPSSLVQEMLPLGLLQHTFDITIQAPGITAFSTPAPITFPNVFGAKPGEKLSFLSFDHTTGRLVIEGSATVSADGLSVSTDPGTGVTHPGWHGLAPNGSPTSPGNPTAASDGTDFSYAITTDIESDRSVPLAAAATKAASPRAGLVQAASVSVKNVNDYLLTGSDESIRFSVTNTTNPSKSDGSYVQVKFIIDPAIANKYLDGLKNTSFKLYPGSAAKFDFTIKTDSLLKLTNDQLIGVKYTLQVTKVSKTGVKTVLPESGDYFAYRYVDAMDDNPNDGILKFAPTSADGANGAVRSRQVDYLGDPAAIPTLTFPTIAPSTFSFSTSVVPQNTGLPTFFLDFDPKQLGDNISATLVITTPGTSPRDVHGYAGGSPYEIIASGDSVGPQTIYLDEAGFIASFTQLASGISPVKFELTYPTSYLTATPRKTFQLTTPEIGQGIFTDPIPLGASPADVQRALENLAISVPGKINVTGTEVLIPATKTSPEMWKDVYTITPLNGFNFESEVDVVVRSSTGGPLTTANAYRVVSNSNITKDELAYLQPGNLATIFTSILVQLNQYYAPVSPTGFPTVVFSAATSTQAGQYSFSWKIDTDNSDNDTVASFSSAWEKSLIVLIQSFASKKSPPNAPQAAYNIAESMSQALREPGFDHSGRAYIERFFDPATSDKSNLSQSDFVQLVSSVVAHEVGHGLGLQHTAFAQGESNAINETQQLFIDPLATTFTLSYAGDTTSTTHPLPISTDSSTVQHQLQTLHGLQNTDLVVTGNPGGPFTIQFGTTPTPNQFDASAGVDFAQITGDHIQPSTKVDGSSGVLDYPFGKQVVVAKYFGRDDLMRSSTTLDALTFSPGISQILLKMGLGDNWTSAEGFTAKYILIQQLAINSNFAAISAGVDLTNDPDSFIYSGPGVALMNADGAIADQQTLDFGKVQPGAPATQTLSLVNFGGEPVVIRSIAVTQGFDQFSVPQFPVTTLQPGESLQIPVTFNSVLNLLSTGQLVVDSDSGVIGGMVELSGTGQLTNRPQIQLSFYNNLGGVQVGTLTNFAGVGEDNNPKLTNTGSGPLTITDYRVAAGQGSDEWTTTHLVTPIVLAPGESTFIPLSFRASKVGLRPGTIEVLSDDPQTPLLRVSVVATGVITNDDYASFLGADIGNDYVAVSNNLSYEQNLPVLRTRSDDQGNWQFFLPPDTGIQVTIYDPVSGLVQHASAFTNAAGVTTLVSRGDFAPSVAPDTDGDGLPDDVEFAIGTNPNRVDTDGDGKSDFAELDGGQNPLDDRPAVTGITSSLSVGDAAHDIQLLPDFRDASRTLAYVASGTSGLTVVDVTDFNHPITIAQLPLPGTVDHISIDASRKLLSASSPTGGAFVVDISDPSQPLLLLSIPISGTDLTATTVLFDGLLYDAVGTKIRTFDARTGNFSDEVSLGDQSVLGMKQSNSNLYVTVFDNASSQPMLRIFSITSTGLASLSSVAIPQPVPAGTVEVGTPFIAEGVAWIPAGDRVVTIDVSDPLHPSVISGSQTIVQGTTTNSVGIHDLQLNGSGLGVAAARLFSNGGTVTVLQTPNATTTNSVFTQIVLPTIAERLALASGLAYVADGTGGLQLVSYLQFDTGSTPPTISLDPLAGDVDPVMPGVQLYEGSTLSIGNHITDDVQVRSVELLVNGVVTLKDLSYPYDLTTVLPKIATAGNQVTLQVRATDTGGNVQLSSPIVVDLVADTTPPTITSITPANGSTQPVSQRQVSIQFSKPLDPTSVVVANFVLHGPSGDVAPLSLDLRQHDTLVVAVYPPLAQGSYTIAVHAAAVKDRVGNVLGTTDITSTFSIGAVAVQPTIRWVNTAGGDWNNPNNWIDVATNLPRVPTATDDVLIDVPTDALVTLTTGNVTVNSIVSNERILINSGLTQQGTLAPGPHLTVVTTMQVNNTFTLDGMNTNSPATFSGTLRRGTGGQGLTIAGEARLDGATIQTDILANQSLTHLWVTNGLTLQGTFTDSAPSVSIYAEGTQTWDSGMFITTGATPASALLTIGSVGTSILTLGANVTFQAQVLFATATGPAGGSGPTKLSLINRGTITALASSNTTGLFGAFTRTESLTNYGIINTQAGGTLSLEDKVWTNAATGHITVMSAQFPNFVEGTLGKSASTTSWTNAGTIELINTRVNFYDFSTNPVGHAWSNTGTIINNKSLLALQGSFTSDDVVNVRNTGAVSIAGLMDNTGRTFTFTSDTNSYYLATGGTIRGGTVVTSGLTQRLEFSGGTLDGVTIQGDVALGDAITDPISGNISFTSGAVAVINGLTLKGTFTIYSGFNVSELDFNGAQTVSGGTFQFLQQPLANQFNATYIKAHNGGPVTFDSTVTLRNPQISGNFISNANIIIDANMTALLDGFTTALNQADAGPFVNRGTVTVPSTRTLTTGDGFVNNGQIVVSGGTVIADLAVPMWQNTGTLDLTGGGQLTFEKLSGTASLPIVKTADLGNITDSGGIVFFDNSVLLDNTNATLTLHGAAKWVLSTGTVLGGAIVVPSTATFAIGQNGAGGILKDVTVNGNVTMQGFSTLVLVGNLTFNGSVSSPGFSLPTIVFGDPTDYPNVPVHILAGTIDLDSFSNSTLSGSSSTPSVTLDPGVVLRGRKVSATLSTPITNLGTIVADQQFTTSSGDVFSFTAAPITNQGTLSAVNKSILRIANLASPSTGIVSAAVGSSVAFTGAFSQTATATTHVDIAGTTSDKFGLVAVIGAATLAGTLDIAFASGYTPAVGDTYQVLTYGSESGTFTMVHVTGLASGLVVTPQYNGTNMTLIVSAGQALQANSFVLSDFGTPQSQAPVMGPAPPALSQPLSASALTPLSLRLDPAVLFSADAMDSISSDARAALTELQLSTKPTSNKTHSAAIDAAFASLEDDLLLSPV